GPRIWTSAWSTRCCQSNDPEPPRSGPETPSRPRACQRSRSARSAGSGALGRAGRPAQPAISASSSAAHRTDPICRRMGLVSVELLQSLLELGVVGVALAGLEPHLTRLLLAIQRQQHLAQVQVDLRIADAL